MENNATPTVNPTPVVNPNPVMQPTPPPQKNNTGIWIVLVAFILIALISAIYFLLPQPKSPTSGSQIPTGTVDQTTTPTDATANKWTRYDGTDYSYDYPAKWTNGEGGKALYNLMSPNFQANPFQGSVIIVTVQFVKDPADTMDNLKKELDEKKITYQEITIDNKSALQYDQIVTAGDEETNLQSDYKTITVFYNADKKIQLMYVYAKDHKNDELSTYTRFLTSFHLK